MTGNYWLIVVGNYVRALFDKVQLRGWILTKNLQSLNLAELLFTNKAELFPNKTSYFLILDSLY